jgi:hypothetical protein
LLLLGCLLGGTPTNIVVVRPPRKVVRPPIQENPVTSKNAPPKPRTGDRHTKDSNQSRLNIRLPKGLKTVIEARAREHGQSVAAYLVGLVRADLAAAAAAAAAAAERDRLESMRDALVIGVGIDPVTGNTYGDTPAT